MSPKSTRTSKAKVNRLPLNSTNGAVSTASTVSEIVCPASPRQGRTNASMGHQTHGAITPLTGPITSVSQLVNGGRNVAKGSGGSFVTLAEYGAHLRTLDTHDLRRHAITERIVPIDDRERLIRRLEAQWTATATKHPGRAAIVPVRTPFTAEQLQAQAAIREKLLKP